MTEHFWCVSRLITFTTEVNLLFRRLDVRPGKCTTSLFSGSSSEHQILFCPLYTGDSNLFIPVGHVEFPPVLVENTVLPIPEISMR